MDFSLIHLQFFIRNAIVLFLLSISARLSQMAQLRRRVRRAALLRSAARRFGKCPRCGMQHDEKQHACPRLVSWLLLKGTAGLVGGGGDTGGSQRHAHRQAGNLRALICIPATAALSFCLLPPSDQMLDTLP